MTMVAGPIGALTGVYAQLREAGGAADRLFELLDTAPEVADAPDAAPLPGPVAGRLGVEEVWFRYDTAAAGPDALAAPPVLRGVSLDAAPGRRSRWSGRAAPASRRWSTCCCASTTRSRGG